MAVSAVTASGSASSTVACGLKARACGARLEGAGVRRGSCSPNPSLLRDGQGEATREAERDPGHPRRPRVARVHGTLASCVACGGEVSSAGVDKAAKRFPVHPHCPRVIVSRAHQGGRTTHAEGLVVCFPFVPICRSCSRLRQWIPLRIELLVEDGTDAIEQHIQEKHLFGNISNT
ncbi:hypothetical protein EJB05_34473, partial [Eragrostis curvula]